MYLLTIMMVAVTILGCGRSKVGENHRNKKNSDSLQRAHYSNHYQWGQLKVRGGGYVTGIIIHPKDKNTMYIRTDVGCAYKWDAGNKQWIQMLNWVGPENANLIGVDGMAIDLNNPDRIYLALGKNIGGEGGIYRSEDRGKTWKRLMSAHYAGNGRVDRWTGECIAVDPNSSKIIYAGTRTNGLWRSTNDGANWSKVTDVPDGFTGKNPTGIRSIVFDPAIQSRDKSSIIYAGIPGTGIYRSTDGGESFSLMAGSPTDPARMQVVNQELFVTHASGVALWSAGQWQDITLANGKNKNYVGFAVDKTNDNKIVVAQRYSSYYNSIYRSENRGKTWEKINTSGVPANLHVNVPWWPQKRFSAATSCMAFVPGSSGALCYTDWFGIWYTPDVWNSTTDWYTIENGHEETVVLTLVAPPEGTLVYSGMADNFGFGHTTLTDYPKKKLYGINEGFSMAVCEQHPSNMAILGAKSWGGDHTLLSTSSDFGKTWTDHQLPAGTTLGRIAIFSIDPDNMIYVAGGGKAYYTKNRGSSWTVCLGAPENAVKKTNIWNKQFPLKADRVNGNFYLFKNGILYVSKDGGATWQAGNKTAIPNSSNYLNVDSTPDQPGEVWISLDEKGLWKTDDGGLSSSHVNGYQFGKTI